MMTSRAGIVGWLVFAAMALAAPSVARADGVTDISDVAQAARWFADHDGDERLVLFVSPT